MRLLGSESWELASFISNVDEERLSSIGKAVDQGGYCDHLEPNLSKGKAECKVFWGMRGLNPV